jgi:hypothetical protein
LKSRNIDFNKGNSKVGVDSMFTMLRKDQMQTRREKTNTRTRNSKRLYLCMQSNKRIDAIKEKWLQNIKSISAVDSKIKSYFKTRFFILIPYF